MTEEKTKTLEQLERFKDRIDMWNRDHTRIVNGKATTDFPPVVQNVEGIPLWLNRKERRRLLKSRTK